VIYPEMKMTEGVK